MAVLGLHFCVQAFSSCGEWGRLWLQCVGFSLQWLLSLQSVGSGRTGFSNCGACAQQLRLWGSRVLAQQL